MNQSLAIFKNFLQWLKQEVENVRFDAKSPYYKSGSNENGFEILVEKILIDNALKLSKKGIESFSHFGHHFPDISIKINSIETIGLELKSARSGNWKINGGSFLESVSDDQYSDIYVFFGLLHSIEKSGSYHYIVKYKPYWEAISDIKVTHSPRYMLNLLGQNNVYDSWEEYDKTRKAPKTEKIKDLKKYLHDHSNEESWYVGDQILPLIYGDLSKEKKDKLVSEALILFPGDFFEITASSKNKYFRAINYFLTQYYVVAPSIRDCFSAGGRKNVNGVEIPKIVDTLKEHSHIIKRLLTKNPDPDFLKLATKSWEEIPHDRSISNPYNQYKNVIQNIFTRFFSEQELEKIGDSLLALACDD